MTLRAIPPGARLAPGSMPERAARAATATQRLQALGRLPAGQMNKTEAAYAALLDERQRAGDVLWWKFEGVKLRLADSTFYTPDFSVMRGTGLMEMHEVKGHWLDDSRAKIKIAAALFPFRFVAVKARPKRDGGGFSEEVFGE